MLYALHYTGEFVTFQPQSQAHFASGNMENGVFQLLDRYRELLRRDIECARARTETLFTGSQVDFITMRKTPTPCQ